MTISFCKIWVGTLLLPEGSRFPWSIKWSQSTCIAQTPGPCGAGPVLGARNPGKHQTEAPLQAGRVKEAWRERRCTDPEGSWEQNEQTHGTKGTTQLKGFFLKEEGLLILSIFCFSRNLLIAYFLLSSTEEGEQHQTAPNTHTHTDPPSN